MQGFSFQEVKTEYEWPVTFDFPVGVDKDGNAEFATRHIICIFTLLPKSDVMDILNGNYSDETIDVSLLKKFFAGWKKGQVKDDAGEVIGATPENVNRFLDLAFVQKPIIRAYFASLGGKNSQRKN